MEVCTGKSSTDGRKVARTYQLAAEKVTSARRALGSTTATEVLETALDLVLMCHEPIAGTGAMLGVTLAPAEPRAARA